LDKTIKEFSILEKDMNRFKKVSGLLFIITITIIGGTMVQNFINDEDIIMAQEVGGPGLDPIDPKNVTEQIGIIINEKYRE